MQSLVKKEVNDAIDALEVALLNRFQRISCPLNHTFGHELYIREIFLLAGSKHTTKIHKFRHPFFIMKGSANIWMDGRGWEFVQAPYYGMTESGTRRVLEILTDMNFITVHGNPDNTEDLKEIEDRLIESHINPLLTINNENKLSQ